VSRATVAEALKHPTWTMGKKITVDSATLVNKALEVIEAHFLFAVDYEQVEVVIHPQSVIHAFAEFVDGSVLAQVGFPTMELPILYALTYPERVPDSGVRRFDPVAAGTLTFEALQLDRFPAYAVGREAARLGGTAPALFNAANEVAVQPLDEKVRSAGSRRSSPGWWSTRITVTRRRRGRAGGGCQARRLAQEAACS
jgi:1-deoxy-D-xylulose-5-phosphate reductoisomerase